MLGIATHPPTVLAILMPYPGVHPAGISERGAHSDLYRSRWLGYLWREEALAS